MAWFAIPTRLRLALRGTLMGRWYAHSHQVMYRWSGGRLGGHVGASGAGPSAPVLLLTTLGRRSGRPHTTPLIYLWDSAQLIVLAANAGHPRDRLWQRFATHVYAAINEYARHCQRQIPIVVLRRHDQAPWPSPR